LKDVVNDGARFSFVETTANCQKEKLAVGSRQLAVKAKTSFLRGRLPLLSVFVFN